MHDIEKIIVRKSRIDHLGVFTLEHIDSGEIITQMSGELISYKELKKRYLDGSERICDPLQISEKVYIDLAEPYVFINHSCTPNAGIRGRGLLFALKSIRKGEELTFDYSTTEWTYSKFGRNAGWEMNCNCESKNCRGIIKQFPYLPDDVKKYYYEHGALQDFILRKLWWNKDTLAFS